ncbi:MAG TPA: AraC family transcriptional regulator [Aldersonia sp.]
MSVVRGTSLTGYPGLVAELGGDPDALLRAAGVRPADVGRFDAFLTYRALIHAVESAAHVTATPDFGRRLGRRQGIEILGAVGVAARTSRTVAEAFTIFEHYLAAYSPAIAVRISPLAGDRRAFFEFAVLLERPPPHPQVIELSLGVALRVFRFLLGSTYAPLLVHLPHDPLTPRAEYRHYFSCPPRFAARTAGFTLRAADLARPLVPDELAHRTVVEYLNTVVDRRDRGVSGPVRDLVRQLLPTGAATLPVIAAQFRLHPKALQRRLAAENTTFAALVDGVRQDLARHYLRETDMTLTHLARELGYAEHSVLTRSCRRWFGTSPAALRQTWRPGRSMDTALPPF